METGVKTLATPAQRTSTTVSSGMNAIAQSTTRSATVMNQFTVAVSQWVAITQRLVPILSSTGALANQSAASTEQQTLRIDNAYKSGAVSIMEWHSEIATAQR
jgi:hypothetical protein